MGALLSLPCPKEAPTEQSFDAQAAPLHVVSPKGKMQTPFLCSDLWSDTEPKIGKKQERLGTTNFCPPKIEND